jgi:cob(I)alamin adenosyltransferase
MNNNIEDSSSKSSQIADIQNDLFGIPGDVSQNEKKTRQNKTKSNAQNTIIKDATNDIFSTDFLPRI